MKETEQQHQAEQFVEAVFSPKDLIEIRMLPSGKRSGSWQKISRGTLLG